MSIPVPPKKQSRADAADAADDSENEEAVPVLPVDDDDDTASDQSDDDTNTTNDASSSVGDDDDDDDDAEPSEGEDDGDGGDSDGGGGGGVAAGGESKKNVKKRRTASKKNTEDDLTLLGVPHGIHFDDDEHDDDDDSDDDDENEDKGTSEYFQKLKSNVRESYIATYHPESLSHNYDEIQTLSRVVRNSAGIIVDDLHRTIPIMTKYEKTRILGQRAKQLNEGAPAFIKIDSTVIDGYLIAVKELEQKRTPFIIRRPLPNGGSEYWRVQDLEIL